MEQNVQSSCYSMVRGLKVVLASIGLSSNNPALLNVLPYLDPIQMEEQARIWTIFTAIRAVEEVPFGPGMDGYIHIFDSTDALPEIMATPDRLMISGDISGYERDLDANPSAKRYSLFGNGGILTKFAYTPAGALPRYAVLPLPHPCMTRTVTRCTSS